MATGTGSSRPLWLALLGIGIVVLIISGDIGGDPGAEEFDSAGESMMSTFRIAGQESSRRIVVVIGSLIVLAAGIGLFRTFSQVPDDDADPVVTRGLSGSALAGATDMAPGPERRGPPPEDRWTDDVEFDPTRWDHPAGILFVFEGRSASGFYELVQRICRERLGRSGLLVGLMQGLELTSHEALFASSVTKLQRDGVLASRVALKPAYLTTASNQLECV